MDAELEMHRERCMALCNKLMRAMNQNREDADRFCGGDIHKAYVSVNEKVNDKVHSTYAKIRNLL